MPRRSLAVLVLIMTFLPAAPAGAQDDGDHGRVRFLTSRPGHALPLTAEEDAFVFAVFGDRTGGPAIGVEVLRQAVGEVNLFEPDLVMTVGDLIEGYNTREPWLAQMREFRSIMDELDMPWFPVAGNHDVYWRGDDRPPNEHESDYEMHFGPLWYAFAHKNAWFITLYSDEGNPETGQKSFSRPEAQRMSPEQFEWLRTVLSRAQDADHVFIFLHHPRWVGGGYGNDWERVHELLVETGNVTAVFAGHIHRMRYDARDGIEYVTLATTGGSQSGIAERAGYLHHFDLVTVRPDHIAIATVPVGATIDPRAVTPEVSAAAAQLRRLRPRWTGTTSVRLDGSATGESVLVMTNPTDRPLEIDVVPTTTDNRWRIHPDHAHMRVPAGGSASLPLAVTRPASTMDEFFRWPEVELGVDYLGEGIRVPMPHHTFPIALEADAPAPGPVPDELILAVSGGAVRIEPFEAPLPQGPFTVETWCRARSFGDRVGLINNTESSGFGIFVNDGRPSFLVHLGGRYQVAEADETRLSTDRWHHVAGVFDGSELRLYIDGTLAARARGSGDRRLNDLPTMIGADVNRSGEPTDPFDGWIDEVRFTTDARYTGERFRPARRFEADDRTAVLLHFDGTWGPWTHDASGTGRHGVLLGEARVVPATGH